MSIIRGPRPAKGWTSIANEALNDSRLEWADMGLLGHLLSLREGARTDVETLSRVSKSGRGTTRAALRRLQEAGYLRRVRHRRPNGGKDGGTFYFETYVYDTPDAAREAIKEMGAEDVSAGQDQCPDSASGEVTEDVSAGQTTSHFTASGSPQGGPPQGGSPLDKNLRLGEDQPTSDRSPAELLAVEVLAGLDEASPTLAAQTGRSGLRDACQQLVDNGWQPAQVRAWVAGSWQNWGSVTSGGGVVHRLRELGRPPKEPEPVVQSQHECPVHPGVVLKVAAECEDCREEARRVRADVPALAAAVRAARRPLLGTEPPTSPRGIDLTEAERVRA